MLPEAGYLIIWTYIVQPAYQAVFEQTYRADGAWAQLFQRSPDYLGTAFYQDTSQPQRYTTLDYWTSEAAYHHFKSQYQAEYAALDRQCEGWTLEEACIGTFSPHPPAPFSLMAKGQSPSP